MRAIALLIAAALPLSAGAQVYKCQEAGRVTYSQEPCAGRVEVIDATPATGGYDSGAATARRAQNSRIMGQQARDDAEVDARRRATDRQRDVERAQQQQRCDALRRDKRDGEYWSKEMRHPDNVRREQERAKQAGSALWWECGKLD